MMEPEQEAKATERRLSGLEPMPKAKAKAKPQAKPKAKAKAKPQAKSVAYPPSKYARLP